MALKDKSLQPVDMIQNVSLYKTNVLWTSGKIFISLPSYKHGSFIFQFYFDLNSELRLNLTFILLHLRDVLLKCQYDKLEVKLNQKLINTKSTYKYCGYYSNFILYPDMHDFIVIISLQLMKPFDLDALFSVTDKDFISNPLDLALNTKEPLVLIQLLCYKIVRKYYLTSFLVSITKIYRLQIDIAKSKEKNYVLYDGPGYRFNILNKKGEKSHFVTSTFQCLLQFLLTFQFKWKCKDDSLFLFLPTAINSTRF